jgi:hypothetical protein
MQISWRALVLAPLLAPVVFSAIFGLLMGGGPPGIHLFSFLILMVPGCVISYGTTICVFLPCLYLLSSSGRVTGLKVCLLGLALGAAMIVPLDFFAWRSSGADSGPPTEDFLAFFLRWSAGPITLVFPVAGLMTAGAYWWLGRPHTERLAPAAS